MAHTKTVQLDNLKKLGTDSKKVNSAFAGLNACFKAEDIIDKIGSRLGQIKGEIQAAVPNHPSIEQLQTLHKRIQNLRSMCVASGGLLELIQESDINENNLGALKVEPAFITTSKALRKIPAEGLPDVEKVINDARRLLNKGMPQAAQLLPKVNKLLDANRSFFSQDREIQNLIADIGGADTLKPALDAVRKAAETIQAPSNPRISATGSNLASQR